jgi:hypothetical protein
MEILADALEVDDSVDPERFQMIAITHAGQHQQLGRLERAPLTITSRAARTWRVSLPCRYSTPTARWPCRSSRSHAPSCGR